MTQWKDRRRFKRMIVNIPAGIYLKDQPQEVIDGEILSISEGGAFVHCFAPINIGKSVLLEIRFGETKLIEAKVVDQEPELGKSVPTPGLEPSVVRWSATDSKPGFGVEFLGLKPDKKLFLTKLLDYLEQLEKAGVSFE